MSEGQRAIKMRDHLQKCLRGIVKIHLTTSHPHNVEKGDKILPHPSQLVKNKLAVKKSEKRKSSSSNSDSSDEAIDSDEEAARRTNEKLRKLIAAKKKELSDSS